MAEVQQKLGESQLDKEDKQRYDTQLNEFQQLHQKVENGNEDPIEVEDRVQAAEDNIEETITTLLSERSALREEFDDLKSDIGEERLQEILNELPQLKELFDTLVRLEELAKKMYERRTYQYSMSRDSKNMLYNMVLNYREDEVNIEAAKRYNELADDKIENIKDVIETMFDEHYDSIDTLVEAEVSKRLSEQQVTITSVEKDMEYLKERQADLLERMAEGFKEVAEMADNEQVRRELEEQMNELDKASEEMKDSEQMVQNQVEQAKESLSESEQSDEIEDGGTLEGKEVEPEEEEKEEQIPQFSLELKATSELKEEFEQMEEVIPEDEMDLESLEKYVDCEMDKLREKLEKTREKFDGQDILPAVEL
jgi:hypothetical protein